MLLCFCFCRTLHCVILARDLKPENILLPDSEDITNVSACNDRLTRTEHHHTSPLYSGSHTCTHGPEPARSFTRSFSRASTQLHSLCVATDQDCRLWGGHIDACIAAAILACLATSLLARLATLPRSKRRELQVVRQYALVERVLVLSCTICLCGCLGLA